jgi:transcription antitermination factor NusG
LKEPASDFQWVALYTKSRHEKFIHNELTKKRIESFLPTRKIKRRWSDRTVTTEEPLFKSYLFVKAARLKLVDVLKTKGAVKFVSVQGQPVTIRNEVIAAIQKIVSQDIAIDPFPYLGAGDRVGIRSGIFKGVEGYIVRKDSKKCRLVISVDALAASISIEVDSSLVEKI